MYESISIVFDIIRGEGRDIKEKDWTRFKTEQRALDPEDDRNIIECRQFEFVDRMEFFDVDMDGNGRMDRFIFTMLFLMHNRDVSWCKHKHVDPLGLIQLFDLLTRSAITVQQQEVSLMRFDQTTWNIQCSYLQSNHSAMELVKKFLGRYFDQQLSMVSLSKAGHVDISQIVIWMGLLDWMPSFARRAFREKWSQTRLQEYLDVAAQNSKNSRRASVALTESLSLSLESL